jgi:hypothetical protein
MREQDASDVGGDAPRQRRRLADDVIIPIAELRHGVHPETCRAYEAVAVRTQQPWGICSERSARPESSGLPTRAPVLSNAVDIHGEELPMRRCELQHVVRLSS